MSRRRFLQSVIGLLGGLPLAAKATIEPPARRFLIQESPLAGFQYHQGAQVWDRLRTGHRLTLVREPDNPYDPLAVAIHWREHRLGYLPRAENTAVAQMLDRGERLHAGIHRLRREPDPWERVILRVWLAG